MKIEQEIYDGSLIHNRFAYTFFKDMTLATGNIVAFRAPAKVETEFMIDQEDLVNNDFIYSDDMIHFCYELPCTDLFGGVCFQRLFCSYIGDILSKVMDAPVTVEGDDIFVTKEFTQGGIVQQRGKASVSIVGEKNGAILGHTGINVKAGKHAPAFAFSTEMDDNRCAAFQSIVMETFYKTTQDVFIATTKVII